MNADGTPLTAAADRVQMLADLRYASDSVEALTELVNARGLHGLTGVALFLHKRSHYGGSYDTRGLAQNLLRHLEDHWDAIPDSVDGTRFTDSTFQRSITHSRLALYYAKAVTAARPSDFLLAWSLFHQHARHPPGAADVLLGTAGVLTASLGMLDVARRLHCTVDVEPLRRYVRELEAQIDLTVPLQTRSAADAGAAHGWAGYLHALLAYEQILGDVNSAQRRLLLRYRIDELIELAASMDIRSPERRNFSGSWCRGSPGLVHTLVRACELFGPAYHQPLLIAGLDAGRFAGRHTPGICCGYAGAAYALSAVHHYSGDAVWNERAVSLARVAAFRLLSANPSTQHYDSLLHGLPGIALVQFDASHSNRFLMPIYDELSHDCYSFISQDAFTY